MAYLTCALLQTLLGLSVASGGLWAPVVTIPLAKQYVPVKRGNSTVSYKTAYFGKVNVGMPDRQTFTVVFDTGSGHFFLPSTMCEDEACLLRTRYNRSASGSAVDINNDGSSVNGREQDQLAISYGTGKIRGQFVDEKVCLDTSRPMAASREDCFNVRVVLAKEMTSDPFRLFNFDGVLGLGLEALALHPEFSFFGQMVKSQNLTYPHFSYYLSNSDDVESEISFGGHKEQRLASPLQWAPVVKPELGYWQVRVRSIRVGNDTLPLCEDGDCVAIVDTGTSLLGVPKMAAQNLHMHLARKVPNNPSAIDCRTFPGPDLIFDLGDGIEVSLGPGEYSRPAAVRIEPKAAANATADTPPPQPQVYCRAAMLPVDMKPPVGPKVFIMGEPVLRKYYTAYDWRDRQIGFALAAHQVPGQATASNDQEQDTNLNHLRGGSGLTVVNV